MIRKRIFGLLLAMTVVFAFLPMFSAEVNADTGHNHDGWTAWAASEHNGELPTEAGSYYLTEDVELSAGWSVPAGDTKLCLNGHVIKIGTLTDTTYNVINIGTGKTLSLYDCGSDVHYFLYSTTAEWTYIKAPTTEQMSGAISKDAITDATETGAIISISGGAIIGTKHSAIETSGGTFNVYNGSIAGNIGSEGYWQAPILITNKGTCNMYGGNIIGNTGIYGGIVVYSGYLNMYGGAISYNIMQGGGGIYSVDESGLIRMEGGVISHNKATSNNGGGVSAGSDFIMTGGTIEYNETAKAGGGVYVNGSYLFKMSGGTITDNISAGKGGGVSSWGDKSVIVGGTAQITGNKKVVNDVTIENNCEIDASRCIMIGTGTEGNGVAVPVTGTSGMKVGVTKRYGATKHEKAVINARQEYMDCFISDDDSMIRFMDNATPEDTSDDYFECAQQFNIINNKPVEDKESNNGYIIVDAAKVCADDTVTVTVCTNTGYKLKNNSLSVKNVSGYGVITVTQDATDMTKYTFVMKDYNVSVTAEFEMLPTTVNLCNGESVINNATAFPTNPAFGDYVFAGWYDAEIGGNKVESFVRGNDYYAHWKRNSVDEHFILTLEKGISIGKDTGKNTLNKYGIAIPLDADILNDKYGISFDSETNTLSLNDAAVFSYSSENQISSLFIAVNEPVTVDVTGDCMLGGKRNNTGLSHYGIKADGGDIAITGSGKLTINTDNYGYGIYTYLSSTSGDISISVNELDTYGAYDVLYTNYQGNTMINIEGSKVTINDTNTVFEGNDVNIENAELTVNGASNKVFGNGNTATITNSKLVLQDTNGIECIESNIIVDNSTIACDLSDSGSVFYGEKIITLKGSPVIYDSPSDKTTFSVAVDGYWHPTIDLKDYTAPEGGAKLLLKCDDELGDDLAKDGPITVVTNVGTGTDASKMPIISADCEGGYLGFTAGTEGATDIELKPADIDIKLTGVGGDRKLEADFTDGVEGVGYQWLEAETAENNQKGKGVTALTEVNEITSEKDIKSIGDQVSYIISTQYCGVSHFSTCNADGSYTGVSKIPNELTPTLLSYVGMSGVDLYVPMVMVTQKDFAMDDFKDESDLMPFMTGKDRFDVSLKTTGNVEKVVLFNITAASMSDMLIELSLNDGAFTGNVPMGFYLVFIAATGDTPAVSEFKTEIIPAKDITAVTRPTENEPDSDVGADLQETLFGILGLDAPSATSKLSLENDGVYTGPMTASDNLVGMFTSMMGYQVTEGEKLYIPMYLVTMSGFDFETVTKEEVMMLEEGSNSTGDISLKAQNTDKVMLLNFATGGITELTEADNDIFGGSIPFGLYMVILSSKDTEEPVISDIDYIASATPSSVKIDESSITPLSGKTGTNLDYSLTVNGKAYGCRISIPQNGCIAQQNLMTSFILSTNEETNSWITDPAIADIYYGMTVTPVYEAEFGNDTVTVTYEGIDGTVYLANSDAPTAAGSYKATFEVDATNDYGRLLKEIIFKINKTEATALTVPEANTLTYNGQAQSLVSEGTSNDGTVQYKLGSDGTYADTVPTAVNAGTYTVYYKVVGDSNHVDSDEESIEVTLSPLDVAGGTVGSFDTMTYTGSVQTPSATVTIGTLVATGTWSNVTNVSDTTTFTANGNFTGVIEDKATGMAKVPVTAPAIAGKVYNGSLQKAEVPASELYTVTANDGGTAVGNYDVILTLKDSVNYKWENSDDAALTLTFEITARPKYVINGYADSFGNKVTADYQNAEKDTDVTLSVLPAEEYILSSLSVTTAAGEPVTVTSDYKFTMPADAVTVTAVFTKNTYAITGYSDAEGNAVTADADSAAKGDKVTLTVLPADNYGLSSLTVTDASGAAVPVADDMTFTMPASAVTVNAEFEPGVFEITGYGDIYGNSVTADVKSAAKGENIKLTVSPANGYYVRNVNVTDENGNPVAVAGDSTFVMPAAKVTVSADFAVITYEIITYSDNNGNSVTSNMVIAQPGNKVTLTVKTAEGFELKSLTVADAFGNSVTLSGDCSFVMPSSRATVHAVFEEEKPDDIIPEDPDTDPVKPDTDSEKTDTEQDAVLEIEADLTSSSDSDALVKMIEESDAKKIVLNASEKSVTEQGLENKKTAEEADGRITEVTKEEDSKAVVIDEAVLESLADAGDIESVEINTSVVDLEFDAKSIESINKQKNGDIKIVVKLLKEEIAGNENESSRAYFEISMLNGDGTPITEFDGGEVKITMPIPASMQGKELVCVYTDGNGHYSPVDGKIQKNGTFASFTTHFSEYILMTKEEAEELYNSIYDYLTLQVKATECTADSVKLDWNRYDDAEGYIVYGSLCNGNGKKYRLKKLAVINDPETTEFTVKGLEEGRHYKFRVKAFKVVNGKKYVTVKTYLIHAATNENGRGITSTIKTAGDGLKKNRLTLKKSENSAITAKRYDEAGKAVRHVKLRYQSGDTSVAKVTKAGVIKAVGKGKCSVFVIAENGLCKEIKVTVK